MAFTMKTVDSVKKRATLCAHEMARRMETSRSSLDRLFDPKKTITLATVEKAAKVLGKRIHVELV